MKSGELFAGVGGLGLAVNDVFGATPAWFSEFDAAPSKVLAHHYPDVPNFGDVTKVDWATVPRVNILAGGFPCQDVSLAGRRAGMKDGTRSGLWSEYLKAIDALRPDWVVIENVRGLYSARADSEMEPCTWCLGDGADEYHLRALDAVLADLSAVGFDAEWTGLRAAGVGAPHGRFRVFILAWPRERAASDAGGGRGRWGAVASGRGSGARTDAPTDGADPRDDGASETAGLTLLPTPVAQPSGNTPEEHLRKKPGRGVVTDLAIIAENGLIESGGRLLPTTTTMDANASGGSVPANKTLTDAIIRTGEVALLPTPNVAMADGGQTSRSGNRKGELLLGGIAAEVGAMLLPTPTASEGDKGGPNQAYGSGGSTLSGTIPHLTDWGPYESAILRWESVIGRPAPAPVRFDGKGGKPRLNPELTEWMMGWPAAHVTDPAIGLTRAEQLKACGNGVVPQQAAAALRILLARPGVPSIREAVAA